MINESNFRIRKNGKPYSQCYCTKPELIENYNLAIADKTQVWDCHHRNERFYAQDELISLGLYCNCPPCELIFLTPREHCSTYHVAKNPASYKVDTKRYMLKRESNRWSKKYPDYYNAHKKEYADRTKKTYEKDKKIICLYEGKEYKFTTLRHKIGSKEARKYIINGGK